MATWGEHARCKPSCVARPQPINCRPGEAGPAVAKLCVYNKRLKP